MPSVLLSLVSWNSADSIEACIQSALTQTYADFELWVVDNASADDTCARVEALAATDTRIKLHRLPQNTGFCGGHNYSLDRTESDYVLLVNPDIELSPNYLERAVAAMERNPRIGTVCGLLVQSADTDPTVDSAGMNQLPDGRYALRLHSQRLSQAQPAAGWVDGADGALPLYHRRFIDDLRIEGQFFDERFFAHKEDWDISWRGALFGWGTWLEPSCVAIHPRVFRPGDLTLRKRLTGNIRADAVKNQLLLLLKNLPKRDWPRTLWRILPRQVLIFCYILLRERASLRAYRYVWQHWREVLATRRIIQRRAANRRNGPPAEPQLQPLQPVFSNYSPTS